MPNRSLEGDVSIAQTLGITAHAASVGGLAVDLIGFNSALVIFTVGDWVDGIHTFGLEHSDDGSDWSVVAAGDMIGTPPVISDGDGDRAMYEVSYIAGKRYLRAVCDITDSPEDGATYGAVVVRGDPINKPA